MLHCETPDSHDTGEEQGLFPTPNDAMEGLEVKAVPRLAELIILPLPLDTPLVELVEILFLSASARDSATESRLVPGKPKIIRY